jgi:hypothetical protein
MLGFAAFTSAPFWSSAFTLSVWPLEDARCSAVSLHGADTLHHEPKRRAAFAGACSRRPLNSGNKETRTCCCSPRSRPRPSRAAPSRSQCGRWKMQGAMPYTCMAPTRSTTSQTALAGACSRRPSNTGRKQNISKIPCITSAALPTRSIEWQPYCTAVCAPNPRRSSHHAVGTPAMLNAARRGR